MSTDFICDSWAKWALRFYRSHLQTMSMSAIVHHELLELLAAAHD
jgi:hypothetical protein